MNLTEKEREVIEALIQCKTQREAAKKVFMSVSQFEFRLRELKDKTGCDTTNKLIAFAYENNIIEKNKENLREVDPSQN